MLGKRGRPTLGRTVSMTEFTLDAPPSPAAMIGGEYAHMLSPRFHRRSFFGRDSQVETAEFLRSCGLCNRRLVPGRDIYMYRGETAFCSLDCREEQMKQDETNERRAAAKTEELAAAAPVAENVTAV